MPAAEVISLLILGLAAGLIGGLLGVGGSIVMIPVLTLVLNRDQHLSQAAAMIVNVFVALPSLLRHHRVGAVDWKVVRHVLPAGLLFIVLGVEVSNRLDGTALQRLFGVFLVYVIIANLSKIGDGRETEPARAARQGWGAGSSVGAITGFAAGLLGIGGGVLAVPLLQRICGLPLRRSIAVSAAAMCVTAVVGALRKNLTLAHLALDPGQSLLIAAALAPTAVMGGLIGAGFTHAIPLRWLRAAFIVLLSLACAKFFGVL